MPGDREDEICQKALQLLAELCSVGAVENENCRDFIYYLRDRARPRLTDSGKKKNKEAKSPNRLKCGLPVYQWKVRIKVCGEYHSGAQLVPQEANT